MRRLQVGLLLFAFVLSIFFGRLVQLQVVDSSAYAAQAEQSRLRKATLPAVRGDITDAHGETLATTVEVRTIFADPPLVKDTHAAEKLAPLLGVPAGEIEEKLRAPGHYVPLKFKATPELADKVRALDINGIGTLPDSERIYPNGSLAANILGFVHGSDGRGAAGLEYSMDGLLAGHDGEETVEVGLNGREIPTGEEQRQATVDGRDVRLTIDRDIQWKAQELIARQVKRTEAQSGSVIVMDVHSGHLLALATSPTFDPNHPGASSVEDRGNRPLQDVYEPGSTSKVITAAAALERDDITPTTPFTVPPELHRGGTTIHDAEVHGTEQLTLTGILAKSSNIGIDLVSERVGVKRLYRTMRDFGFGRPTGIGFPGESKGILPPPDEWSGSQRYTIPFGQGVAVNAVQMASVYATIANGGVRVEPGLVAGTTDEDGTYVPSPQPGKHRVLSERTARELGMMLESVTTEQGTAPAAQIPGYRVAGKTGTADRVDPDCGCYRGYTSTFVGFAPADDPQLVVEVVLQDPKRGHYGGQVAAPVFADVMSFALASRKVPPTGTDRPKIRLYPK